MSETPQSVLEAWLGRVGQMICPVEVREAIRAVLDQPSVAICREERDRGNGGCGACALCCKEQREAKEKAEAEFESLLRTYNAAAAAWGRDEAALTAERDALRAALREWREAESSPDCIACCTLDAALCDTAQPEPFSDAACGPRYAEPKR